MKTKEPALRMILVLLINVDGKMAMLRNNQDINFPMWEIEEHDVPVLMLHHELADCLEVEVDFKRIKREFIHMEVNPLTFWHVYSIDMTREEAGKLEDEDLVNCLVPFPETLESEGMKLEHKHDRIYQDYMQRKQQP